MEHDARGSFDGLIEVKRPKSPREATDRLFELFGQMGQWEKKTIAMEITYEAGEDLEREDIPAGYLYLKIGGIQALRCKKHPKPPKGLIGTARPWSLARTLPTIPPSIPLAPVISSLWIL